MTSTQGALALSQSPFSFNFHDHSIRIIIRDGLPWFVASDVCAALGYINTSKAIADHLDDDERSTITNSESRNGGGKLVIISESGLYALVLRSRKPEARKFAKWVTSEVLPAIRKTGSYTVQPARIEETPPPSVMLHGTVEQAEMTIWVSPMGCGSDRPLSVTIPAAWLPFSPGDLVSLVYPSGTDPLVPNEMYRPLHTIHRRSAEEFAQLLRENLWLRKG